MKSLLITLFFIISAVFGVSLKAQSVTFDYDDSGNCVLKYKTVVLGPSYVKKKSGTNSINASIEESIVENKDFKISILPNPTKGMLKIIITGIKLTDNDRYILSDSNGKLIDNKPIMSSEFVVNMTSLSNAVYFITLITGENKNIWKIIKE